MAVRLWLSLSLVFLAVFAPAPRGSIAPAAAPSAPRTFVLPHVLERTGRITDTQNTFDHMIEITYSGDSSATVLMHFFDSSGKPMESGTGAPICNPCTATPSTLARKVSIRIDDMITLNGGFAVPTYQGYAVFEVEGEDPNNVGLTTFIVNSHTGPFDLARTEMRPVEQTHESRRTWVIPHILEKQGSISDTQFTFDTTIFATYTGASTATTQLFLYSATGSPLTANAGTAVCNPCTFDLTTSSRKVSIRMDDLIQAAGGFASPDELKTSFALLLSGGSDPDHVTYGGFVVNSHTSPFDLSVFGFEPQPIAAEAQRTIVFPHVLETSGSAQSQASSFDTTIFATYTPGLADASAVLSATLQIYLYSNVGQPMMNGGAVVCNPCTVTLDGRLRKYSTTVHDLILATGTGFDNINKLGYAVIVVGGADPDGVSVTGFIVNTHTGPFDVSMTELGQEETSGMTTKRTFVLPHVLEREGTIANTQFTFDTTIFATYTGTSAVTVEVHLYDQEGARMDAVDSAVCGPCTFSLTPNARKASIRIDDLITHVGGFDTNVEEGFAQVVITGADPGAVALSSFVVNSHTGPFDLDFVTMRPLPVPDLIDLVDAPAHPSYLPFVRR